MVRTLLIAALLPLLLGSAEARERPDYVIEDPFIDLHTGPGRGYPIFYIAERGDRITVVKRRTDWFKVVVPRGEEGWVHREQLMRTLDLDGDPIDLPGYALSDHAARRWEAGVQYGDFGGANVIGTYGALNISPNLSVELWFQQVLGRFSNSNMVNADIVHLFYADKRWSPFFTLGVGVINTSPKATLVAAEDRKDSTAHAGFGIRTYLTRRFVFRAEYKSYVVFTSRDDNEEVNEWKAGFSFFF